MTIAVGIAFVVLLYVYVGYPLLLRAVVFCRGVRRVETNEARSGAEPGDFCVQRGRCDSTRSSRTCSSSTIRENSWRSWSSPTPPPTAPMTSSPSLRHEGCVSSDGRRGKARPLDSIGRCHDFAEPSWCSRTPTRCMPAMRYGKSFAALPIRWWDASRAKRSTSRGVLPPTPASGRTGDTRVASNGSRQRSGRRLGATARSTRSDGLSGGRCPRRPSTIF